MGDDNYPRFVIMVMGGSGGLCLVMRESGKKKFRSQSVEWTFMLL